ncbi:GAF domain-containing sensor histidine kinase [Patescibacteria group bacterium]|nr:GAF domain-containing sensor histidine kinase [Patescibacteria group bacterium]
MESLPLLATGILNILLGAYVIYENPKKALNLGLFFFALGASGWILSLWATINFPPALWVSKITFISPLVIVAFLAFFVYELEPKSFSRSLLAPVFILAAPSVFIILVLVNKVVTSVGIRNNHIINTYGSAYPFYGMLVLGYILGSLFYLLYKYHKAHGVDVLRLKYALLGLALMLIPSVITNLILPLVFKAQNFNTVGPISATFMVILMTYAIVRYHLLEIWVVVRMGVIFSLVFAAISFVYIVIVASVSQYTGLGYIYSLILSSLVITLTFEPLKQFIEKATDRIFFHKHYNFNNVIEELTSTIHTASLDLERLLKIFNEIVKSTFKVSEAEFAVLTSKDTFLASSDSKKDIELSPNNPLIEFLKMNEGFILNRDEIIHELERDRVRLKVVHIDLLPAAYEELVKLDFTLAIPISSDSQMIAIYFIGAKSSNDLFTTEDLRLLDHLTSEAGVLINNARLYGDLKKLDEAKSNFISVVSHQLRTPLSAVRWSTELLLDGTVDLKAQKEFLKDTYKNSLFVIERLDDMLTALDVEDKNLELKKEPCRLRPLIDEIVKENEFLVHSKKIDLTINLEPGSDTVECDTKKMKKMLEVLLNNAFWYVPESGGSVTLAGQKRVYGNEPFLEISVSDNGIGVSPDEQRYMFEKFFRGEAAKRMSPNGFGLGLFIVRAFARAHGGDAHFESAGRGKGAKFYFTVKREEEKKTHA